jgi:hypothetical protein
MAWLDTIDSDPILDDDARNLARVMVKDFCAQASNYVTGHDREFAEAMGVPIFIVAKARKRLVSAGHLIALQFREGVPSFKLSSCRW